MIRLFLGVSLILCCFSFAPHPAKFHINGTLSCKPDASNIQFTVWRLQVWEEDLFLNTYIKEIGYFILKENGAFYMVDFMFNTVEDNSNIFFKIEHNCTYPEEKVISKVPVGSFSNTEGKVYFTKDANLWGIH